jgi:lysophospholipase L1-like esterase
MLIAVTFPLVARATLESEIQAFEAEDALHPPPPGATLFVGSSTFNSWPNLAASFPSHSVLNRGFGGSQMSDVLFYFDRVVAPYRPPYIVVYEGDNDLAAGKSVAQVFTDYSNFLARVEQELPGTIIGFVSVKPSPSRVSILPQMQQLNALVRDLAGARGHRYIDTHTPMLTNTGQPRPELFLSDMLHMNAQGYALWTEIIEPVLDEWEALMGGTFLLDFGALSSPVVRGPEPNDPVRHWNNIGDIGTSPTGVLTNLVTVQNVPTAMGFAVINRFNSANESGTTSSSAYPANATRDSLFGNAELFGGLENIFPKFKLTGLDARVSYSFTFFASRTGVGDNRETGYTVVGANQGFAALDAANNVDSTVTVGDITPDAAGEISISLAPTENNNNPNHFTYLGVLRVDAIPPQSPLVFTREPASQSVVELQSVTFSAAVSGTPPYFIQWMRDGQPIEGATEFSYTIPSATLDLDGSAYSVTVSNLAFSVTSSNAVLRVTSDSVPPQIVSVTARDSRTLELAFDELLDSVTANVPSNYEVNAGEVEITSAQLQADGKAVVLTLAAPLVAGSTFTVVINDVQDISFNSILPDTTVTGSVPGPETQVVLVDFGGGNTTLNGPTPDDPLNHWNNVPGSIGTTDGGQVANLVTTSNIATGIGLAMLARFNGANENGTTATAPFPVDATRDSLFGNTELFSGLANIFPKFKLTGLDPTLGYDLTFYASRTGVGDNRTTRYTVEGAETNAAELNVANNVTNVAEVLAARPSEAGELTISLTPAAANNNANHFTYLGALKLQPAALPPQITAASVGGGQIALEWIGGGVLESAPQVTGPWTEVEGNPNSPASLTLTPEQRFFRIKK